MTLFAGDLHEGPSYTAFMDGETRHTWELEELREVLAARHAAFEEQYKLLMAKLSPKQDQAGPGKEPVE